MNIFFDVDFTLVGVDGSLRPGVKEVLQRLREDGHRVYLWSGLRVPWDAADRHGLTDLIHGCYAKPIEDHRSWVARLQIPEPHFCIDDNQETIAVFGGYTISPYIYPEHPDEHMWRVYQAIVEHVTNGHTTPRAYGYGAEHLNRNGTFSAHDRGSERPALPE
ncbi:MAG: hypothetical protein HY689_06985 [Chloroflexi bacterium]|nr:hypothetical protein [Chloroflexota bacterium]